jgi:hypothetical protein
MNACGGMQAHNPLLDLGTSWRGMISFTPWSLCPRVKSPGSHWTEGLGGTPSRYVIHEEKFLAYSHNNNKNSNNEQYTLAVCLLIGQLQYLRFTFYCSSTSMHEIHFASLQESEILMDNESYTVYMNVTVLMEKLRFSPTHIISVLKPCA